MTQDDRTHDAQFQYVEGQARPHFPATLADFQARSDRAAASEPCTLDLVYGPHERERFDFFPSRSGSGAVSATLVYFHAGYWQLRDKSLFRFIAPAFTRRGLNVALVDYPLCPNVTVAALLDSARNSIPAVQSHLAELGQTDSPLIAAGHSAGGQIAVEMALSNFGESSASVHPIVGVIAISGVYDLEPLVDTTLNDKLQLDAAGARAVSPLHRAAAACPALFVVGSAETPAFLHQSRAMHEAWRNAGNDGTLIELPGRDHFSVLDPVLAREGRACDAVDRLLARARNIP